MSFMSFQPTSTRGCGAKATVGARATGTASENFHDKTWQIETDRRYSNHFESNADQLGVSWDFQTLMKSDWKLIHSAAFCIIAQHCAALRSCSILPQQTLSSHVFCFPSRTLENVFCMTCQKCLSINETRVDKTTGPPYGKPGTGGSFTAGHAWRVAGLHFFQRMKGAGARLEFWSWRSFQTIAEELSIFFNCC